MNDCVKTGFRFVDLETAKKHTGDLFFFGTDGGWNIRGIPANDGVPFALSDPLTPDASLGSIYYTRRANSTYLDSGTFTAFETVSQDFREHIREYYPHLIDRLPPK